MLPIAQVLDQEKLAEAEELIKLLNWHDGTTTAGKTARQVKRNHQADLSSRSGAKLRTLLETAIKQHAVLKAVAQPRQFSKLLLSRTEAGGGYGMHVDNAYMPNGETQLRTDLSFTLFLSPPNTYEGGELEIETGGQTFSIKLKPGDLILYPSSSLHRVKDVQSGSRLVCVGWIESRIQRPDDRDLLLDVINLKTEMAKQYDSQSPEMLKVSKILANLKRRFA